MDSAFDSQPDKAPQAAEPAPGPAPGALRSLYEATPALLHSVDADGRLLTVSDTWAAKLGYSRAEVLGRFSTDFLTPSSRRHAQTVALPMLASTGRYDGLAVQMVCKSGQVIDVLISAVLERDAQGQVLRTVAVCEDVTLRRQAEAALQDERQRLANLIESTHAGTWEWHVPSGALRVNERWAEMLGHRVAELQPLSIQTWRERTHPDDLAQCEALLAEHFGSQHTPFRTELRMRHRLGHWVWLLVRGRLLGPAAGGQAEWMYGIHQDITERKLADIALLKAQAFLDRTGRLAGVGGWELDVANESLTWSDETCRIHGVPAGHRPGLDEAIGYYAPEAQPLIRQAVSQAISSGTAFDLELPLQRADGAQLWVRAVGSVEQAGQRSTRVLGAFQDITRLVAERHALKEAQARMQLATDSGGIGIWQWNLDSGLTVWDAWMCRLYGLVPRPVHNGLQMWQQHVHPDDAEAVNQAVADCIKGGERFDSKFRVTWADGSVHHLRGTGTVSRDARGRAVGIIGTNWDITESRRLSSELAAQHELLRVTLQSIGDAVITSDSQGLVQWLNPAAERLTGWSAALAQGQPMALVFHIIDEETRQAAPDPVAGCLRAGPAPTAANAAPPAAARRTLLLSRNGDEWGVEDSVAPIRNSTGQVLGAVLVFHDVTEQRRLSGEMNYRASHDALTGLINRSEFEARLQRLLHNAQSDDSQHALLYIDLDQFKLVNDACGHTVGDQLLRQVAKLFAETARARDTLARLGGDEFALILEHCPAEHAQRVAQQVCDRMDDFRFSHEGRRFRIGTSIGLVPVDARWAHTSAIMQAADTACYAAKEAGRNRVHVWRDSDHAVRTRHGQMQWTSRIEQALDDDGFVLFAQRVQALAAAAGPADPGPGPGVHAEVLLRMQDHDGSLIPPGAFLPAAERFNLASRIDRWVLKQVLRWMQAAPSLLAIDTLSVNLSGQSIGDRAFHRWAIEQLSQAGPLCHKLCLEITETAAVTNLADAAVFIAQVRALGVRVALDDFGAGASSFGYLKTLKVDFLKIDGQFIRDVVTDPLDAAAVRCFADVAKVMGLKTVAEFVDQSAVLERLRVMGIDYVQGYLIHKPAPLAELLLELTPEFV